MVYVRILRQIVGALRRGSMQVSEMHARLSAGTTHHVAAGNICHVAGLYVKLLPLLHAALRKLLHQHAG
jgi:hypothetical protein